MLRPLAVPACILCICLALGEATQHPIVAELCHNGALLANGALPGLKRSDVMPDIARLCGQEMEAAEATCEGDFQTRASSLRSELQNAEAWPDVLDPTSAAALRSGTTHAGGMRGLRALPAATGVYVARRVGDTPRVLRAPLSGASDPRCAMHAHNATRLAGFVAPGDVVLALEVWFTPTTFPSPCCASADDWKTRLVMSQWFGDWVDENGPIERSYPLWSTPSPGVNLNEAGDFSGAGGLGLRQETNWDASRGVHPWADRRAPVLNFRSVYATYPDPITPSGANAVGSSRPLGWSPPHPPLPGPGHGPKLPGGGGGGGGPGRPANLVPRADRPHQLLALLVIGAGGRSGMLRLPNNGVSGYSDAVQEVGTTRITGLSADSASAQNATVMARSASLLHTASTFVDGDGASIRCTYDAATQGDIVPPWLLDSNSDVQGLRSCFGGHNTTCDLEARSCGTVATLLRPDVSNATVRERLMRTIIGSYPVTSNVSAPSTSWQVGYMSMAAWWKPCQACGQVGAVREGRDGAPVPACNAAACRANLTRIMQSRAVAAGRAPPPAALDMLSKADGGCFAWYDCATTPYGGWTSGRPQCTAMCPHAAPAGSGSAGAHGPTSTPSHEDELVAWITPADGDSAGSPGRGWAASRPWLMAWAGMRAGPCGPVSPSKSQPEARGGCVSARTVIAAALDDGTLLAQPRLPGRPPSSLAAGAGRASVIAAALVPALAAAIVDVTLDVPVGELWRVSRAQFLLEVAEEAALASDGAAFPCVRALCAACPPADDMDVWDNASLDPATGMPPVPSRATSPKRLVVSVVFVPPGPTCAGVRPERASSWLVDASQRGHDPVAFEGPGANATWAARNPGAARVAAWDRSPRQLRSRKSPALLGLSLANAIRHESSHRILGRWLVWANATAHAAATARVVPRCLLDFAPAPVFVAMPWWQGQPCREVITSAGLLSWSAVAALPLLTTVATMAPSVLALRCGHHKALAGSSAWLVDQRLWAARTAALTQLSAAAGRSAQLVVLIALALTLGRLSDSAAVLLSAALGTHAVAWLATAWAVCYRTDEDERDELLRWGVPWLEAPVRARGMRPDDPHAGPAASAFPGDQSLDGLGRSGLLPRVAMRQLTGAQWVAVITASLGDVRRARLAAVPLAEAATLKARSEQLGRVPGLLADRLHRPSEEDPGAESDTAAWMETGGELAEDSASSAASRPASPHRLRRLSALIPGTAASWDTGSSDWGEDQQWGPDVIVSHPYAGRPTAAVRPAGSGAIDTRSGAVRSPRTAGSASVAELRASRAAEGMLATIGGPTTLLIAPGVTSAGAGETSAAVDPQALADPVSPGRSSRSGGAAARDADGVHASPSGGEPDGTPTHPFRSNSAFWEGPRGVPMESASSPQPAEHRAPALAPRVVMGTTSERTPPGDAKAAASSERPPSSRLRVVSSTPAQSVDGITSLRLPSRLAEPGSTPTAQSPTPGACSQRPPQWCISSALGAAAFVPDVASLAVAVWLVLVALGYWPAVSAMSPNTMTGLLIVMEAPFIRPSSALKAAVAAWAAPELAVPCVWGASMLCFSAAVAFLGRVPRRAAAWCRA